MSQPTRSLRSARYCPSCGRALRACLCEALVKLENRTPLLVLQHPNEQHHPKGTAHLLTGSLQRAALRVGSNWQDDADVAEFVRTPHCYLLWPGEDAVPLASLPVNAQSRFVLLDGTWRKCYRMLMENPLLAALPRVALTAQQGHYHIRKAPFAGALSTLEAGYHLLCEWEGEPARYQPLWTLFERFNQQWQSFRRGDIAHP